MEKISAYLLPLFCSKVNLPPAPPKTAWFTEARFGLFIHWGLYSVAAGEWRGKSMKPLGEWIQSCFRIPNAEYAELAREFEPVGFDADEWVSCAKRAGMRYLVFTAKHHDGFAMYGSKVDRYNIVEATPLRRDPLAELARACSRHGLRLGLYYSQDLDWHDPDGGDPGPLFPKNLGAMSWGNDWDFPDATAKNFNRYFNEKALPQVAELLTRYGPISVMWFDCPLSIEKTNSDKLMQLVHSLQPDCLVNSRIGNGYGDFGSMGDNEVPVSTSTGIWETPATLNDTWGFKSSDQNWKTGIETLAILISLASAGVNYLLNIGPQADGRFPEPSIQVLRFLSDWMEKNSSAIHGTNASPFATPFIWGWVTAKAADEDSSAKLYLIFRSWAKGTFQLRGLRNRVFNVRGDVSCAPITFSQDVEQGCARLRLELPEDRSSHPFPVLMLEVEGKLDIDERILQQGGQITLMSSRGRFAEMGQDSVASAAERVGGMRVGPAGEITVIENKPSLDSAGTVINWLSSDYEMGWDLMVLESGVYEVELHTSVPFWLKWHGGQRIRFALDEESIESTVQADQAVTTPETRYCPQAISRIGMVKITDPGAHRATLRPLWLKEDDRVGLALVRIALRRIAMA